MIPERERQRALERQRKEQRKKERVELREERLHVEAVLGKSLEKDIKFDPETMEDEHVGDLDREMSEGSAASGGANSGSAPSAAAAAAAAGAPGAPSSAASSAAGSSRDADPVSSDPAPSSSIVPPPLPSVDHEREHDRSAHEFGVVSHKEEWPKVAHAQNHDISHSEAVSCAALCALSRDI